MRIWPRSAFRVGAWGALHPGSGIRPFRAGAGARPRVVPSPAPAPQYGRLRRPASSPSPSRRSTAGARGVARPAAAAVRDPTPGRRLPQEAVREVWRGHGSGWWGYAGRCDRSSPTAASAHRTSPTGVAGPGDRTAEVDRRHRDVRRLLAAGPAPSPASPPHARLTGRHPIGCTYTRSGVRPTDIYALARDTPGRRSRDTPRTRATPPAPSNVDTSAHRRAARRRRVRADAGPGPRRPPRPGRRAGWCSTCRSGRLPGNLRRPASPQGASTPQPATDNPRPGASRGTSEGGEPVWQRRQGPVTRRSPRGDGCTWSTTRIPTSRDGVRPSAVTADSRAAGGSKPPSC